MAARRKGVLYNSEDYTSVSLRVFIIIIDALSIIPLFISCYLAGEYQYKLELSDDFISYAYIFSFIISFLYLTIIKSSEIGTLGQFLTKTKVVNLYGEKPSFLVMVYRLLLWVLGPINIFSDIVFSTFNEEKRMLRDCLSNTLVVKKTASPIITDAVIGTTRAFVFGLNLLYLTAMPNTQAKIE